LIAIEKKVVSKLKRERKIEKRMKKKQQRILRKKDGVMLF